MARKYTKDHEWVEDAGNGVYTVGISDYAQNALGDIAFVELPAIAETVVAGDAVGVVESVKSAYDICGPISGTVVDANAVVAGDPKLVNKSCYGDGWLYKVKVSDPSELDGLMSEDEYKAFVSE